MSQLKPNETIEVYANQGMREAMVLAVLGNEALVEYEMPKGSTALRVVPIEFTDPYCGKQMSYAKVPLRWLEVLAREEVEWLGLPQQSGKQKAPQPRELLARRSMLCPCPPTS